MKKILLPGSFKPVHGGHIEMIKKLLSDKDNVVYVIFSSKPRDGFSVTPSMDFLKQIFGDNPRFRQIVSDDASPVKAAYNIAATKEFGDGVYAMAASDKDDDILRSYNFFSSFSPSGKYYTQGVTATTIDPIQPPIYRNRDDEYNYTPISSRVVRDDIRNDDYENFLAAYVINGKQITDESILKNYFDVLRDCIIGTQPVKETAAGGHINHVWEENDLTFNDISDLIHDIFLCNLDDVTEKIDGISLFASMDNLGRVIFARNKKHMCTDPMTIKNMEDNNDWNEITKKSFIDGANVIKNVFSKIKSGRDIFNYDDKADGLIYRTWVNVEIVNTENQNVIPYPDNFVSFHTKTMLTTCVRHGEENDLSKYETFTDPNIEEDSIKIEQAIEETNKDFSKYRANTTPRVIMEQSREFSNLFQKYVDDLKDIMEEYDISMEDTVLYYKYKAFRKYIVHNKPFGDYSQEILDLVSRKWSGWNKPDTRKTNKILKEWFKYDKIKSFESKSLKKLQKRIMLPLDRLFINIGNDVIDHISGTVNDNNKNAAIKQINKKIADSISAIEETGSEKDLEKLEYMLFRLGETSTARSSEGVVFRWRGKLLKLTGSFQVFNQVINMAKGH